MPFVGIIVALSAFYQGIASGISRATTKTRGGHEDQTNGSFVVIHNPFVVSRRSPQGLQ